MLATVRNSLLSVLFPQQCTICDRPADHPDDLVACSKCWSETTFFTGSEMLCARCGALLGPEAAPMPVFCRKCDEYHFDRAFALGVYEKALSASVGRMKGEPYLSAQLRMAIGRIPAVRFDHDLVVPVPLAKKRAIERGYNQAALIGSYVAAAFGVPLDSLSLARKAETPFHRAGMDQKARELTVAKAFVITRPSLIADKRILLVDDVMTSGATASECSRVLKAAGGRSVSVFTLARAVMR